MLFTQKDFLIQTERYVEMRRKGPQAKTDRPDRRRDDVVQRAIGRLALFRL